MKAEEKSREQLLLELAALRNWSGEEIQKLQEKLDQQIEKVGKLKKAFGVLKQAYGELKELDRAKDAFVTTVTHELRTPLTSIRSFSEILLDYPDESAETKRNFYSIINKESERLTRLIDNVLDLSKICAGKMEWHFRRVDAKSVIERTLASMSCLLREKELRTDLDLEEGLPAFTADEDRVVQVLTNLLSNATKFTPTGGRIRVSATLLTGRRSGDSKDLIHIAVSDSGVGIPPEDLPTIFDRYKQAKNTLADTPRGTGLGLPICKEIVLCHHGNIWVESKLNQGTAFHIILPVEPFGREARIGETGQIPSLSDGLQSTDSPAISSGLGI